MERNDEHFDRASFDAVWRRVQNASGADWTSQKPTERCAGADEAERLIRFMDGEAGDAQYYAALALRCPAARQTLTRISSDEKCHLKRLRAKYFILTGGTYTPPDTCPLIYSAADALRKKYSGEKDGVAAYRDAAEQASEQDLRDTYLELSQDEARHAKTLGRLIENMF